MFSRRNRLTDDQIVNYLITGEDSEDGLDSGDDDVIDPDFEPYENLMSDHNADTAGIDDLNSFINELDDSDSTTY